MPRKEDPRTERIDGRDVNVKCAFCKRRIIRRRAGTVLIVEEDNYYSAWKVHSTCLIRMWTWAQSCVKNASTTSSKASMRPR